MFTGAVGRDLFVEEALAGFGVRLRLLRVVERDAPTGVALIEVAADGETTIVVAPGANAELEAGDADVSDADAVLYSSVIPDDVVRQRPSSGHASSVSTPHRRDASTSSRTSSSSTGSSTRS